jgi:hypothetical protein
VYSKKHYVIKFVSDLIQHYVIKFVSDLIQHYVIKFTELEIKNTTHTARSASFLVLQLEIDSEGL